MQSSYPHTESTLVLDFSDFIDDFQDVQDAVTPSLLRKYDCTRE